ncbi:MAG TPA: peptidoglycan bridge formation glycyltransferase FemA/FemB family protein, partial [Candidatus Woesebacteria bacterium]|nr:peptidoglycan bridge formation glycyltransferase FemA/FemB family protein [Candidatus Woesebacteria bacterium]
MKIQLISDSFSKEQINAIALHPMQTWEWGEARKETRVEVVKIGEFDNDKLINIFQMTLHPVPKTPWKIGYLPRSVFPSKQVLQFLEQYGKENNLIFIKIEPYVVKNDTIRYPLSASLIKSSHPLFPEWTQMLDISKDEETLLKEMKSKTRYNIRLAEKKGVIVKEEFTEEGFEKFIKLYFDTTERQKYYGHTKQYHKIIWDNLKNGIAHILIAYFEKQPLSAYELFFFKDTLFYPYGGSSEKHRDVMASNVIMWEAIKLGKKLGAKKFDMWGSLPPDYDPNNPWSGFTKFKEGYGTYFVEFVGSYDLVINPLLYNGYNVAHVVRNQ